MPHPSVRRGISIALLLLSGVFSGTSIAQSPPAVYVPPGTESDLPTVVANDNRESAGDLSDGTLDLALEVVQATWRPETADGPGLKVVALAESGQAPTVPGPMVRVERGTDVRVSIRNTLDVPISVFGLHERPAGEPDSLVVDPGATGTRAFEAGDAGTYFYSVRVENGLPPTEEREQLAGAFIVDPEGGSPPDRVFMINIFSAEVDSSFHDYGWLEALTINGLSWPYTERLRPAVGDTLRWRVINASDRGHPMHLHGFYFDVTSQGTALTDEIYDPRDRRHVVTENMTSFSTMAIEWVPTRPGNWLFHCHLSFHVTPDIRLPQHAGHAPGGEPSHMAGLVLGIEVQPGPTDLISRGQPREITLHVREFGPDSLGSYGFTLDPEYEPDAPRGAVPGPVLVMKQYQPTLVTVRNHMSVPTGVHWHGLELDSWADGVPDWSASDGRVSPAIEPGGEFTYKLSLMRPGTFIYHSHLDDVHQLTGGLYGALIVLEEGDTFDPDVDHLKIVGWNSPLASTMLDVELNGRFEQPVQHARVGETHRIRLINIAPAGDVYVGMTKDEQPVPLRAMAKDGAEFPDHQKVDIDVSKRFGVGETADFAFSPSEPGTYELIIGYSPEFSWRQEWVVADAVGESTGGQ